VCIQWEGKERLSSDCFLQSVHRRSHAAVFGHRRTTSLHNSHTIAHRLTRYLECQGLLEQDAEHGYLALESADENPIDQLCGHSITYRIAAGLHKVVKSSPYKTLSDERGAAYDTPSTAAGNVVEFSLHAGVSAKANQREKQEPSVGDSSEAEKGVV